METLNLNIWNKHVVIPSCMFLVFQAITSVQRDTDAVKIQSAKTGTPKLLVNARMVICLSRGTRRIVKVNTYSKTCSLNLRRNVAWNKWLVSEFHCKVQLHAGECHKGPFCVHKCELQTASGAGPFRLPVYGRFTVVVVPWHTAVMLSRQFLKYCFSVNGTYLLTVFERTSSLSDALIQEICWHLRGG